MANPVYSRPAYNRYLGNRHTREVHDLKNERPQCRIDELVRAQHAMVFFPDAVQQAHRESYDSCGHCIGGSEK